MRRPAPRTQPSVTSRPRRPATALAYRNQSATRDTIATASGPATSPGRADGSMPSAPGTMSWAIVAWSSSVDPSSQVARPSVSATATTASTQRSHVAAQ